MTTKANIMSISQALAAAMVDISTFDRYSLTYFEWQAEYTSALEAFGAECDAARRDERDPAVRADIYDKATDTLHSRLLDAINTFYPIGQDGKRAERVSAPPPPPVIVVNNEANENVPEAPANSEQLDVPNEDQPFGEPAIEPEIKLAQA